MSQRLMPPARSPGIGNFSFLVAAGCLVASSGAFASGQLPPRPLPPQMFMSFEDCLKHLDETKRADQAGVADGAVARGKNETFQKLLETKGIVHSDERSASYEAWVGYQFRFTNHQAGYIETILSYEITHLECADKELTGTVTSGYALPGYEALPTSVSSSP